MRLLHISALLRLELVRFAKDRNVWVGLTLFIAFLLLDAWQYAHALPPRRHDLTILAYAFMLLAAIAFHTGIARDRASSFDAFLAWNLLHPRSLYAGRLAAYILEILGLGLVCMLLAVSVALGNVEFGIWLPAVFTGVFLMALPLIVLAELALNTRYPAAIVALLFSVSMTLVFRLGNPKAVMGALGLDLRPLDFGGLGALWARGLVAIAISAALYPLFLLRLDKLRTPLRR